MAQLKVEQPQDKMRLDQKKKKKKSDGVPLCHLTRPDQKYRKATES